MLVITRKKNESIVLNHDIVITVVEIRGDKVRLGVVAPREASVHREEVYEAIRGLRGSLVDPDWLTTTVVALARGMSESGDYSALPILADALQDAGCDNDAVLGHCRDAAAAAGRGSWVVDLIIGKS
jgi:carbon storage regulator CsrA